MRALLLLALGALPLAAQSNRMAEEAVRHLVELIKLDTSNPPGNETRVARYLKAACDKEGIPSELIGPDPQRLNFVARLKGTGPARPLLLMAHSDVVPAERAHWTVDPFAGIIKDGYLWGRGAQDTKGLLAAEVAVFLNSSGAGRSSSAT